MCLSTLPGRACRASGTLLLLALAWNSHAGEPASDGGRAILVVRLPAAAALSIESKPTTLSGAERVFESPPLPAGKKFTYTLTATWEESGKSRSSTRTVTVQGGERTVVDFNTPEPAPAPAGPRAATYRVHHALTVKDIPANSKKVRIWFWIPDDDDCQKLLDLSIRTAPAGYQITRDHQNGHRYLYAEVRDPGAAVSLATDFVIRRTAASIPLDAAKAGALTDVHRTAFAEYLRRDCPHMEVNERIVKLANEICGNETNVVRQMRRLYDYVVDSSDHYSKEKAPKTSGQGSAEYCLDMHGGGCTDQHALLIALARARGIPTRLHFGSRLQAKNEGKDHDPGYRCWVQYFVPNYGWVATDVSAGDTNPLERDFFFSGLDERRIRFSEGRDLDLNPKQDGPRLNLMIVAYVEVDGKPHTGFQRNLRFTEVAGEAHQSLGSR